MRLALSYFGPIFVAVFVMALVVLADKAGADAGACYAIQSPDHRAYCLAKARKDPGMCYAIQSADLRAQCLAEVRK